MTSAMRKSRADIVNRLRNEFQAAQRREDLLAADCARQTRLVSQQREKSIQYEMLQREVDSNRQLYEAMLQRVKETRLSAALNAAGVRIVDPAEVPPRPYKPKPVAYACVGGLAGLLLGGGAGAMREFAKRTFRRPGDTASCLQLPELGVITSAKVELNAGRSRKLIAAQPKRHPLALSLNHHDRLELVTWNRSGSLLAECYRTMLASIRLTTAQGNRPKVFVITSAEPEAGKTSVAANLAIALAGINQRVLLIDADMRRPRIHDIFGLENHSGLTTELSDGKRPGRTTVSATEIPGLFVLPSGPALAPASVLVQSARLPELIRDFRKEFDAVVIDTPPMLHFSDARVMARFADAVILVVRAGHTSCQQALAARQRLAEDCTNVLGTVLNDWDPRDSVEPYDGYCGYQT
jgi:capsular exopolysaccharide synthesis family protein